MLLLILVFLVGVVLVGRAGDVRSGDALVFGWCSAVVCALLTVASLTRLLALVALIPLTLLAGATAVVLVESQADEGHGPQ